MNNELIKNIIIVEDDPDIGLMIKTVLEYKSYTALLIERGEDAEQEIRRIMPDLVIMDMLLSGVNGTDICNRLKNDPRTSHIPIIMFSAHPNAQQLCMEAGAEDFMAKPFDVNEMLRKIECQIA